VSLAAISKLIAPSTFVSLAAGWAFLLPSLVTRFGSQRWLGIPTALPGDPIREPAVAGHSYCPPW